MLCRSQYPIGNKKIASHDELFITCLNIIKILTFNIKTNLNKYNIEYNSDEYDIEKNSELVKYYNNQFNIIMRSTPYNVMNTPKYSNLDNKNKELYDEIVVELEEYVRFLDSYNNELKYFINNY